MEEDNTIEYRNLHLFYKILYERTFNLINLLIDESKYDINLIKKKVIDFLDWYSYYLMKKNILIKGNQEKDNEDIQKDLLQFESFYKNLNSYPSELFYKKLSYLIQSDYDKSKISEDDYIYITQEYYLFFEEVLLLLKDFIKIASESGFFPNIKNKSQVRSIGFANHDEFFKQLEGLKSKISEITTNLNITTSFQARRATYCLLLVFSPYFNKKEILSNLITDLSFNFVNDKELLKKIKRSMNYEQYNLPLELYNELYTKIIKPLEVDISLSKRLIAYEFGEKEMSPKIKKKYGYDPTLEYT